jgi:hypothetical protein
MAHLHGTGTAGSRRVKQQRTVSERHLPHVMICLLLLLCWYAGHPVCDHGSHCTPLHLTLDHVQGESADAAAGVMAAAAVAAATRVPAAATFLAQ